MIKLSAAEIITATGGSPLGLAGRESELGATFATTDSREAIPGTLFVAKPGEVTDGHNFVSGAFDKGAVLALVERPVKDERGILYPSIQVDDVVLAMGKIAQYAVEKMRSLGDLTVIGITGSAGKTTTKDLLAAILSSQGETIAPVGSYNGEVGVPLTVFRADESTRYLVIEMGADHVGGCALDGPGHPSSVPAACAWAPRARPASRGRPCRVRTLRLRVRIRLRGARGGLPPGAPGLVGGAHTLRGPDLPEPGREKQHSAPHLQHL